MTVIMWTYLGTIVAKYLTYKLMLGLRFKLVIFNGIKYPTLQKYT